MENRTGDFREALLRRVRKKSPQGGGSSLFAVLFILAFIVCAGAYGAYVQTETSGLKPGGAIRIALDLEQETPYSLSLASLASYNNLSETLVDPEVLRRDAAGMYEFMRLKWVEGVQADELAFMLAGRGVLDGHAHDFLSAAQAYDLNPVYLVAHARLESGNGTSKLACGNYVAAGTYTDSAGRSYDIEKSGIYYNLFGIRAYDAAPLHDGSVYAASQGWDSVSAAIRGGAQWLSENYINRSQNPGQHDQDTLYQMRFDPQGWATKGSAHRYATDVNWAHSIAGIIQTYSDVLEGVPVQYEIPAFAG